MTAPPHRRRCGHPGEKPSRALPSGRPAGLPACNAPPSPPTPRLGTPTRARRPHSRPPAHQLSGAQCLRPAGGALCVARAVM